MSSTLDRQHSDSTSDKSKTDPLPDPFCRVDEEFDPKTRMCPRGRLHTLMGVQIMGIGAYAPEDIVRNEDLAELGYDADWILQRTGIKSRRRASADQATSDLAVEAARRCLTTSGVSADEVDLVIVATMTPDMPAPATACLVQAKLGITAPAFDLSAACSGFVYALSTAMQFVKAGTAKRALVIGADLMSRIVDPSDTKTFPLFGDGAGAVLLGPGNKDQGLVSYNLGADGSGGDLLCVPAGGTREAMTPDALDRGHQFLQMEGRAVFKWAVRLVSDSIVDVLQDAAVAPAEVDLVILHQANIRIIDSAVRDLGFDREKIVVNLDRYGNTSAGSIPLALDEAYQQGRIQRGDHILMCGFGAGLTWGTALVRW